MRIGIDLGTSNTVASYLNFDGTPVLIPDSNFKEYFYTPSKIVFDNGAVLVGHWADLFSEVHSATNVHAFFKRSFGSSSPLFIDDKGNSWYPEMLAALLLRKIKQDAELFAAEKLDGAVITVPAHFNDSQRKSVIRAAELADINLIDILDEPIAAAIHFGTQKKAPNQVILVYDLGGGTFDLTLLTMTPTGIYVLAKDGLSDTGGKEFDELIANKILREFQEMQGEELILNTASLNQLRKVSESVKMMLSDNAPTYQEPFAFFNNQAYQFGINRDEFKQEANIIIDKTLEITKRCLQSVGIVFSDINLVMMVGGGSKLPFVFERLSQLFNKEGQTVQYHEPMNAVAFGAACFANLKDSKHHLPVEYKGVSTYTIAARIHGGGNVLPTFEKLFLRNSPLPATVTKELILRAQKSQTVIVEIVQFWDEKDKTFPVGSVIIGPLSLNDTITVRISFENKEDGTIGVKVKDLTTGSTLPAKFEKPADDGTNINMKTAKEIVKATIINAPI